MVENALGQFLVTSITKRTPLQPEMQAEAAQDANKKTKHAVEFQVACLTNSASHSLFARLHRSVAPSSCRGRMQQQCAAERVSLSRILQNMSIPGTWDCRTDALGWTGQECPCRSSNK